MQHDLRGADDLDRREDDRQRRRRPARINGNGGNFTPWVFRYGCFVLADVLAACSVIFTEGDDLAGGSVIFSEGDGLAACSLIFSEGDGLDRAA